jgi:hypothetical protein
MRVGWVRVAVGLCPILASPGRADAAPDLCQDFASLIRAGLAHTRPARPARLRWAFKLWPFIATISLTACGLIIGDPFAELTRTIKLKSLPSETCVLKSIAMTKGVLSNSVIARPDGMSIGGPGAPLVVSHPVALSYGFLFAVRAGGVIDVWRSGENAVLRDQAFWIGFSDHQVRAARARMIAIERNVEAQCQAPILPDSLQEICFDGYNCPHEHELGLCKRDSEDHAAVHR